MQERLNLICKEENLAVSAEGLEPVVDISKGDLRKAITTLQSLSSLSDKEEITKTDVIELSGVVPEGKVAELFAACKSKSWLRMNASVSNLILEGYPADQVVSELHNFMVRDSSMTSKQKAEIALKLSEIDSRLVDGSDELLQLLDVAASLTSVFIEG